MAATPHHIDGIPSIVPTTIIASFPVGTFLENIAVRSNGTLLVSNMLSGQILYVDPHAAHPQSTVKTVHDFNSDASSTAPPPLSEEEGAYGSKKVGEAIVEDLNTADVFYSFSGFHGKAGTWGVWRLDLRRFDPDTTTSTVTVEKIADVPDVVWLNGGTMLPSTTTLVIAESLQGKLLSCDVATGRVETWLQDPLLGKITDRPPWPAANGVQCHRGHVFVTSSDRAIVVRAAVESTTGKYVDGSLTVVAENLTGDDLAFDGEGSAYVATNPAQTVLKLPRIAATSDGSNSSLGGEARVRILGGLDVAETAGPTAVAFGRSAVDERSIYVTTNGGLVNPVGAGPSQAVIVRADVGVRGAFN